MADLPYHEAPAHTTNDLPVMLPGKLVGRDQILASIYGELKQNRPVLLHGKPGIGKTAIAATLASAYTQQPGGALWLTTDEDSLAALIVRVGRAYGDMDLANSENPAGMVGAAATLLAQHKPFVVLDGHPLMPAVTEFVNKLAPNLPVMILAEDDIPGIWRGFEVAPLSEQDAVTLYSEKSGQTTPEVRQLVGVLGYQPLSIVVSAGIARIAKMDAPAMLAALRDSGGSALQVGFEKLQPALQGILLMLGATFNGSASLELLSMISGAPAETIQKVMTILAAAGFVQQDQRYGSPYYSLHPLVHDYAQRFLRDSGRLVTLQDKVRDTVLAYARKHTGSDESDYDALAVEMDTFLATAHWASQRGEPDVASQITVAMTQAGNFVRGCGYLYELLQLQESGSSGSSPFPANPDLTAPAQMPPGTTLVDDDDLDDDALLSPEDMMANPAAALDSPEALRNAINAARTDGDTERALELQEQLGQWLRRQGSDGEALAVYNEMLRAYEDADNRPKTLATLQTLASIMIAQESTQAAVLYATRGAKLAEELADESAQARLLLLVGDARQQLGESTDAIVAYSQALDHFRKQDDRPGEADALMKLGFAQLDDDAVETAIKTWNEALEMCRDLGKRDGEGRILGGLGTAYGELERWEEAINYHTSALYIAREVSDKKEEALQLGNLGYAARQANRLGDAVTRYRQALHLAYANDERENIVSTIVDLARLLMQSPRHLNIVEMLVDDALARDGSDREVTQLKERLDNEKLMAASQGIAFRPVSGTAEDYARNAYALLEDG